MKIAQKIKAADKKMICLCAAVVLIIALLAGGLLCMNQVIIHRHVGHEHVTFTENSLSY